MKRSVALPRSVRETRVALSRSINLRLTRERELRVRVSEIRAKMFDKIMSGIWLMVAIWFWCQRKRGEFVFGFLLLLFLWVSVSVDFIEVLGRI